MGFHEDVIDGITAQITHIGLSQDGTSEYAGAGYAHQVPTFGAAVAGVADLTGTLAFSGVATDSISHVVYKRAAGAWVYRPVALAKAFNADGRLDLTSAPVTSGFPA